MTGSDAQGREARLMQALNELSDHVMDGRIDPQPLPAAINAHIQSANSAQLRATVLASLLRLLEITAEEPPASDESDRPGDSRHSTDDPSR